MSFEPILGAPFAVQLHVFAAIPALLLGPMAIYRARRDRWHRRIGRIWVGSMALLALSGLFIEAVVPPKLGAFGPIHLLSIWALFTLTRGVAAIRRGDVARHRAAMVGLYWQGLALAGLLTMLPGRRVNALFFRGIEEAGIWIILAAGLGGLALLAWRRARNSKGELS